MNDYYSRHFTRREEANSFCTDEDQKNEGEVAKILERKWKIKLHRYCLFSPVDWWAERRGNLIGIVELKTRSHAAGKYSTVFLNVRKWLALKLASIGLGVESLFVVKFTDSLLWIKIKDIDASRHIIGGCKKIVKAKTDIEPVIEVPINTMNEIERTDK